MLFKLLLLVVTLLNERTRRRIFIGRWLREEVPVRRPKIITVVLARVFGLYLVVGSIWQVIDPSRFVNSKTSPAAAYILGILILVPTMVDIETQRRIFVGWWFENQKPVGRGKIVGVVTARVFGYVLVVSAFLYALNSASYGSAKSSSALALFFGVVILSFPRPNWEERKRRAEESRSRTIEAALLKISGIILIFLGAFYLWRAFPYASSTGNFIPVLMIIVGIGIWSRPLDGVLLRGL